MLQVTPVQHVAADGLRGISIEKRNCRYLDENEKGTLFNYYTYKSCSFECKLRNVIAELNCTDWKLPLSKDWESVPLCTAAYMDEFNYLMGTREMGDNCDCMPDCEEVTFETTTAILPLHAGMCLIYILTT